MSSTKQFFVVQTFEGEMWDGEYLSGEWKDQTVFVTLPQAERNIAKRTRGCDPTVVPLRWRIDVRSIEV